MYFYSMKKNIYIYISKNWIFHQKHEFCILAAFLRKRLRGKAIPNVYTIFQDHSWYTFDAM